MENEQEKGKSVFTGKSLAILVAIGALGYMAGSSTSDNQMNRRPAPKVIERASQTEPQTEPQGQDVDGKKTRAGKSITMAPDFTLNVLDGGKVSLSDYRGKWVLVNFWATWCGPCVVEMPMLENLYKEMKGKPFEILAVDMEAIPQDAVRNFVSQRNLSYPILLDFDGSVGRMYGVESLPFTVIVDPEGKAVAADVGMREWDSPAIIDFIKGLMRDFRATEAKVE